MAPFSCPGFPCSGICWFFHKSLCESWADSTFAKQKSQWVPSKIVRPVNPASHALYSHSSEDWWHASGACTRKVSDSHPGNSGPTHVARTASCCRPVLRCGPRRSMSWPEHCGGVLGGEVEAGFWRAARVLDAAGLSVRSGWCGI